MPERITHWGCDVCHKQYGEYTEALQCESDHALKPIMDKLSSKLDKIFGKDNRKKIKAGFRRPPLRTKGTFD